MNAHLLRSRVFKPLQIQWRSSAFLSSLEARKKFIEFFRDKHGHDIVPSSSIRLPEDQSLLFVNAGMNQFKPKFLGTIDPLDKLAPVKRAVNSQKCIRISGKHNDLEDVGKDTSHHTFFEMLGSWSFGDYFKEKACEMALELLTVHFQLSVDHLYFTYFSGDTNQSLAADTATRDIWKSLGIPESRVLPYGLEDNFWEMGDCGPCGPCTEIHYDYIGRRNASHLVNKGNPDVVEIWNLVFMQYNRLSGGSLSQLPVNHVDTGMGFERLTAILQGKQSNYDTDLFLPMIKCIEDTCDCPKYVGGTSPIDAAYRIVSDHIRTLVISIADNVYPGNTGAELIVRQVLRRAHLTARQYLKAPVGILSMLSPIVINSLCSHYKYLKDREADIGRILGNEEKNFSEILTKGENLLLKTAHKLNDANFPLETAILLYNHYGYPLETMIDAIKERDLKLDLKAFYKYQEEREHLKEAGRETVTKKYRRVEIDVNVIQDLKSENIGFTNYGAKFNCFRNTDGTYNFPAIKSKVVGIISEDGELKKFMTPGEKYAIIFDKTCFYHTDGGQISDTGAVLRNEVEAFTVEEVTYAGGFVFHHGLAKESVEICDEVELRINSERRQACMRAHTATHMLNHALREVLSLDALQQGSKVGEDKLRFTFSGPTPSSNALSQIVSMIRHQISMQVPVYAEMSSLEEAIYNSNIRRLQDVIYSNPTRVVSIGTSALNCNSVELCGGTHVQQTGDIEQFELISSKSQGLHKTTLRCLTSSRARHAISKLSELELKVRHETEDSHQLLTNNREASPDQILKMKSKIGKLNFEVNCAEISIVRKTELKETLRKHSQMLSTKIRSLQKHRDKVSSA